MSDVAAGGRTVLFVSHNMAAVAALCPSAILLRSGRVAATGPTAAIVQSYLSQGAAERAPFADRVIPAGPTLALTRADISPAVVETGGGAEIRLAFEARGPGQLAELALLVYAADGARIGIVDLRDCCALPAPYTQAGFDVTVNLDRAPLVEGQYKLGLYVATRDFAGDLLDVAQMSVDKPMPLGSPVPYPASVRGVVAFSARARIAPRAAALALSA
jgi:lipopolysaccharide transport system ATP-binding protein